MNIEIEVTEELVGLIKKRRQLMNTKPTPDNFTEEMKDVSRKISTDVALQIEWYLERGGI